MPYGKILSAPTLGEGGAQRLLRLKWVHSGEGFFPLSLLTLPGHASSTDVHDSLPPTFPFLHCLGQFFSLAAIGLHKAARLHKALST